MPAEIDTKAELLAEAAQTRSGYTSYASVAVILGSFLLTAVIFVGFRMALRRAAMVQNEKDILRRSEARFRPLIQSSADVISVISDDLVSFISPSIEKATGIKAEAFIGQPVGAQLPAGVRPAFLAFYEDVKARPNYVAKIELSMDLGFATKHFELVASNRLADPDVKGVILNIRDVT